MSHLMVWPFHSSLEVGCGSHGRGTDEKQGIGRVRRIKMLRGDQITLPTEEQKSNRRNLRRL